MAWFALIASPAMIGDEIRNSSDVITNGYMRMADSVNWVSELGNFNTAISLRQDT